jgi:hypothetical protein
VQESTGAETLLGPLPLVYTTRDFQSQVRISKRCLSRGYGPGGKIPVGLTRGLRTPDCRC